MEAVNPHGCLSLVAVEHLAEELSAVLQEQPHESTLVVRNWPVIAGLHGLPIADEP